MVAHVKSFLAWEPKILTDFKRLVLRTQKEFTAQIFSADGSRKILFLFWNIFVVRSVGILDMSTGRTVKYPKFIIIYPYSFLPKIDWKPIINNYYDSDDHK